MINLNLTLTKVSKFYPKEVFFAADVKPALANLSFDLLTGQTLGLIGANGAGKSTCIRLMMDFIRPDSGTIRIDGCPPGDRRLRHRIGYLPEVASFPPNLTLSDMLRFVGATHQLSKARLAQQAERWLRALDLWEVRKRPLQSYSKGMQQRASFVLALVHDPELLILDEPMSGLDPIGRAKISALITDLKAQGKTILFCSHILEDVDRLADRLLILHKGEKRFDGTLPQLHETYGSQTITQGFLRAIGEEAEC
ncbi:MAG: ABC transporter ATP-binding protein [Geoalkalibacter sp.]|uniref:ABC transporter ATP-binding protein n=1 Tax=Geoalkalibacter sp. TaxID=3041440 RepID=UPI003D0B82D8